MTNSTIYTFEREYASGGHIVGEMLAEKLGIPFYDSKIVDIAAEKEGVSRKIFQDFDEKPTSSFLYSLVLSSYGAGAPYMGNQDFNMSDRLFAAEADIIRKAAEQGPCVIVGRCGSYILRDNPNVVRVFCTADMEFRKHHALADLGIPERKVEDTIARMDKKRANYFNYYTGLNWNDASNYDLCVSTSRARLQGAMEIVLAYGEMMERMRTGG